VEVLILYIEVLEVVLEYIEISLLWVRRI